MFAISLDDPQAADRRLAGDYAAAQATARQAGAPIAPGFIVPTTVYRTAPHGEITPDVEAAIAAAYAALGDDAPVTLAASAAPAGEATAAPRATYGPLRGLSQIVRYVEQCWQASPDGRGNPLDGGPEEIAVLVQRA